MPVTYFDSQDPILRQGVADVDRVYRLAWDRFTEANWASLSRVYQDLPGFCGYIPQRQPGLRGLFARPSTIPYWFGSDERVAPHLAASVEPPGLQVTGVLAADDFERWHHDFMRALIATDLPAGESE